MLSSGEKMSLSSRPHCSGVARGTGKQNPSVSKTGKRGRRGEKRRRRGKEAENADGFPAKWNLTLRPCSSTSHVMIPLETCLAECHRMSGNTESDLETDPNRSFETRSRPDTVASAPSSFRSSCRAIFSPQRTAQGTSAFFPNCD